MGSARLLAMALAAACAQPALGAEEAVHGLFVGVADYRFGTADGALRDLDGAPNDVAAIRQALATRHALASSTVLLDAQATRAGILAALDAFASGTSGKPGETLIFYYTGHGAQAVDMGGSQVSGFHSTLVPWDARDPEMMRRDETGDILDVELRDRIDAITARGINVVSIFDSCNSGSATRNEGRSKTAPRTDIPASVQRMARVAMPAATEAAGAGYRVHLAAAVDNSEAFENQGDDGKWRSDFTVALARALAAKPAEATYREIFEAVDETLAAGGKGQQPRAEGALLTPFLAPRVLSDRLFSVSVGTGGTLSLAGGRLALVTPGARMAVYPSAGSAASAAQPPLGTGKVVSAGAANAQLDLVLPEARGELVAREIAPGEGSAPLTLAGAAADGALDGATREWRKAATGGYRLEPRAGMVEIARSDGARVTTVAPGAELAQTLDRIARHDALAALAGKSDGLELPFAFAAADCNGANPIDFAQADGRAITAVGKPVRVTLTNPLPDTPLYFYLLYLGSDYSISLLEPAPYSQPAAWPGGACASRKITPDAAGRQKILLVASTAPLPGLSTLDQPGIARPAPSPAATDRASDTRGEVRWAVRALDIDVR